MKTMLPLLQPDMAPRRSPDWVRISYASAVALRFKSGRFTRDFDFGGINLLLSYDEGCLSDCGYCGLARTRPGQYEDKSFIRVEWPLVETDELVRRLARYQDRLTRLCISMVTHGHSYRDTLEITRRIRGGVATPLSLLVAPPTLTEERLRTLKEAGADIIGIGLDAVTEQLFRSIRTDVPQGGLSWAKYWEIVDAARDVYGPWNVNCHTLVGLGESDRDLMAMFARLLDRQIHSYLFCFNPEPDSRMGTSPKSDLTRWRRIQLAKFLLEERGLDLDAFGYDQQGALMSISAPPALVEEAIAEGFAFMTNGCPGAGGEPGCTRPMGSWRPSEAPRDYPWQPTNEDARDIREELRLDGFVQPGPGPSRPPELCAPPVAGRPAPSLRAGYQ
jgi:biotin synthase-related radical SAM superfamily protein